MRSSDLPPSRTVCTRRLCLPHLVQAATALDPNAPALLGPDGAVLTYADLEDRSNRMASYLKWLGVDPEVPVAICLERSFEFVIAALAVWKAGGAYLPLDPSWPVERRQEMIDDSQAPVLITRSKSACRVRYLVDVDLDAPAIAREPAAVTPCPLKRDNLALVIYTSGTESDSRPRGVEVTHGNLLNLVFWHRRTFRVTQADRASHVAGIAFDAAVWELWPYLSAGAAVAIPPESSRACSESLRDWLTAQSITIGFVPSALAEPLIAGRWPQATALRYLLTGSDTLHRHSAAALPFRLVNHYGPTECTVVATSGEIPHESAVHLPIGAPVANMQVHVLDDLQRPVEAGEMGEIYVSGSGVARGYRNRADLTAERFFENPFSSAGARMYRTGDLGRVLLDGRVIFCGRRDEPRTGPRIHLKEIVRMLDRHPSVISSAVAIRGQGAHRRLVAYVVLAAGYALTAAALRDFLAGRLPEHMVPSVFVRLAELPLNSNGKLDRAALPDASEDNCLAGSNLPGPTDPIEHQLMAILKELLQREKIGSGDRACPEDGGSTLRARLIARIKARFAVQLSPSHLFEGQSVAQLAAEIERRVLARRDWLTEEQAVHTIH
jgi:amino acid adenylation domain-containing protein